MENTKATINLREGIISLEGSEEFVKKYLDDFKIELTQPVFGVSNSHVEKQTKTLLPKEQKEIKNKTDVKSTNKSKVKDIRPEQFDIYPKDKLSLKDFIDEKKPNDSIRERALVIGYYIKNTLNLDSFTEGNIEYVYRTLKLNKKPIHLRQALIDLKNKDQWIESVEGNWVINRVGEKIVDEKLPHPEVSKK
jgi:hypothetical protein